MAKGNWNPPTRRDVNSAVSVNVNEMRRKEARREEARQATGLRSLHTTPTIYLYTHIRGGGSSKCSSIACTNHIHIRHENIYI